MGALYLALSGAEETAKLCVIKTVLPHLADKEYLQRFRDEAKVVVRLSHGNLVPVFDSGQADGEIYLAMDFVDGRDLRAIWNRCAKKGIAFPIDVAVHIVKELCRGLALRAFVRQPEAGSSRRLAAQRAALVQRRGQGHRLRSRVVDAEDGEDRARHHLRQGQLHVPGAGARRAARRAHRSLRRGHHPVGAVHRAGSSFRPARTARAANDAPTAEELLQRVRYPEIVPPSKRATRVPAELDRIACKALAPGPGAALPDLRGAARAIWRRSWRRRRRRPTACASRSS